MSPTPPSFDVLAVGEAMILLEPPGTARLADVSALDVHVAGAELNACAAAVALGGTAAYLTRLGDDPLSERVIAGARELGVEVLAERAAGEQPGVFFKQPASGDERSVYYYRSASAAARMDESLLTALDGVRSRVTLVSGLTAALGDGPARLLRAVATAGVADLLAVDANLRPQLGHLDRSVATVHELLPHAWLLCLGRDEGAALFGTDEPRAIAAEALRRGCREVVIKDGARGAHWVDDDGLPHRVPAVRVEVVDTVGAGDAFTGSYVWARLSGRSRAAATRLAVRVAARVVAARGDTGGLPAPHERAAILAGLPQAGPQDAATPKESARAR